MNALEMQMMAYDRLDFIFDNSSELRAMLAFSVFIMMRNIYEL